MGNQEYINVLRMKVATSILFLFAIFATLHSNEVRRDFNLGKAVKGAANKAMHSKLAKQVVSKAAGKAISFVAKEASKKFPGAAPIIEAGKKLAEKQVQNQINSHMGPKKSTDTKKVTVAKKAQVAKAPVTKTAAPKKATVAKAPVTKTAAPKKAAAKKAAPKK